MGNVNRYRPSLLLVRIYSYSSFSIFPLEGNKLNMETPLPHSDEVEAEGEKEIGRLFCNKNRKERRGVRGGDS